VTQPDTPPVLHLIAGINGAGKTSLYQDFLAARTPGAEFVNADDIERARWPGEVGQHSYQAGELAARRREELIQARVSFVTETVFSHPSKLALIGRAQAAGFLVVVYHVHVASPELAIARVRTRVAAGGHDVPPETLIARFPRSLDLIRQAALLADRAYVFDNSRLDRGISFALGFEAGRLRRIGAWLPDWVKDAYGDALRAHLEARIPRD
jgi:predicted ABC-type ATPase